jgi:hypothetical protein
MRLVDDTVLEYAADLALELNKAAARANLNSSTGPAIRGVEFLRTHAGPSSEFYRQAAAAMKTNKLPRVTMESVAWAVGSWVRFHRDGMIQLSPEVEARVVASTDLMEQVRTLMTTKGLHPAAAVMLAGAALEEYLRSRIVELQLKPKGRPGINVYASALVAAGDLTTQEKKDIDAWAGMRNTAAHGQIDKIERGAVELMEAGINLFFQKRAV